MSEQQWVQTLNLPNEGDEIEWESARPEPLAAEGRFVGGSFVGMVTRVDTEPYGTGISQSPQYVSPAGVGCRPELISCGR